MSKKSEPNRTPIEANSESAASATSDICVVENSSDNSAKSLGWHHSPLSSIKPSVSPRSNMSPILSESSTPPSPSRPVSGLKRIIRAPPHPSSPKRPNREIVIAIEKLRPVHKYKFNKPNGNTPNFKFAKEETKFTANSSTPKRSNTQKIDRSQHTLSPKPNKHNQSNKRPSPTSPYNRTLQKSYRTSPQRPPSRPEIVENVVLEKAYSQQQPEHKEQQSHHSTNTSNHHQPLHHQLRELQNHKNQTSLANQHSSPPQISPRSASYICHSQQQPSPLLSKARMQCTPPLTPPLLPTDQPYPVITQNPSPKKPTQQETFERQFQKHIQTFRKSEYVVEPPPYHQISLAPTTPHPEQQQQQSIQSQKLPQPQLANNITTTTAKVITLPSDTTSPLAINKIPSIFIPQIASIEKLFEMIKNSANPINFSTTCGQEGGVRVKCADAASYSNLLELLHNNNIQLHTHQMPQHKGVRIVIKNLHATTPVDSIRSLLSSQGYTTKYINVLKNRFTGIPLNIFEVELDAQTVKNVDDLLKISKLGSQEVTIERQARRIDPVQCHRCQAYGHSKNYCRRAFICMKCAGSHPTSACTKDRGSSGTCANCGKGHVASYKGCPVYKKEREKLLAVRFANQPAAIPSVYQQPADQLPQQHSPHNNQQQQQQRQPLRRPQHAPQQPQVYTEQTLKQQAQTPQLQTPQERPLHMNSPKFLPQIVLAGASSGPHSSPHGNFNRKTYSQITREVAKIPRPQIYTKPNSQMPLRQSQTPLKPSHKQQQQQLQQLKPIHNAPHHLNKQTPTILSSHNLASSNRTLHQQNDLLQIQKDVSNNTQSITRLNDKIDHLLKLVYDHLGPTLSNNQNTANDNANDAKQ